MTDNSAHMNIVFVGHVDHGKSTIVGRLLADTKSLPQGKLEALQADCLRQNKPFEYAFLIDALKDERRQNITIDTARIFFKSKQREYLILDAPGHIEFIKNMVTGASHAEAAVLVIDANEGVMANSRRHGVLLSLLGIRQLIVIINKMDLVNYDQAVFERVRSEYLAFLEGIGITPQYVIPVSGVNGEGVAKRGEAMPWYHGPTILQALDLFTKTLPAVNQPLRLPIQDVYRFSADGDQRRIIAGTLSSGKIAAGDALVAYPSGKQTHVQDLVMFNREGVEQAEAGEAVGLTMQEQIYIRRGEILCKQDEAPPSISTRLRASLFWIGREPLVKDKTYLFKLGTAKEKMKVDAFQRVLDATSVGDEKQTNQAGYHEVAELTLRLDHPVAFDTTEQLPETNRFVIVDGYEIAGGGIVLEALEDDKSDLRAEIYRREQKWIRGNLDSFRRAERFEQEPKLIIITGPKGSGRKRVAKALEEELFAQGRLVYYLGIGSVLYGVNADLMKLPDPRKWPEHLRRFGEVCHTLLDTGTILIVTAVNLGEEDISTLRTIVAPIEVEVRRMPDTEG